MVGGRVIYLNFSAKLLNLKSIFFCIYILKHQSFEISIDSDSICLIIDTSFVILRYN